MCSARVELKQGAGMEIRQKLLNCKFILWLVDDESSNVYYGSQLDNNEEE